MVQLAFVFERTFSTMPRGAYDSRCKLGVLNRKVEVTSIMLRQHINNCVLSPNNPTLAR